MNTHPIKPRNPYVAGRAIAGREGFFGREDIIETIIHSLNTRDQTVFALTGQRRIGKTSVLLQLEQRLQELPFAPVYLDLLELADKPLGVVVHRMASRIADAIKIAHPPPGVFDDQALYFLETFLPAAVKSLEQKRALVLLIDEFDILDPEAQQASNANAPAAGIFRCLRELIESEAKVNHVIVIGRRFEDLSASAMRVFRTATHKRLSVLNQKDAITLILLAQGMHLMQYTPEAVTDILHLTGPHPYFIQLTCQKLFDRAYRLPLNQSMPTINRHEVEAAIPEAHEAGAAVLEYIWESLPSAERIIFSAVAEGTKTKDALTSSEIDDLLEAQGLNARPFSELLDAPSRLVAREMFKEVDGAYACFAEIVRRWVAEHKSLRIIKAEMDRLVPAADILFQAAKRLAQIDEKQAIASLKQALDQNPQHLQARLFLAQTLLRNGQTELSVEEYEKAYQQDRESRLARFGLIESLVRLADKLDHGDKEDAALEVIARALSVSPNERGVRQIRNRIWERRGKSYFKDGELEKAQEAFEQAEDQLQVEEVKKAIWLRTRDQLAAQASAFDNEKDFESAKRSYAQLQEFDPGNSQWVEAHNRVETAIWQSDRDALALQGSACEQKKDWEGAKGIYAQLQEFDPRNNQWVDAHDRVETAIWQRDWDIWAQKGMVHEAQEEWPQARDSYLQLRTLDPENKQWVEALERIETDERLAFQYATALMALKARHWVEGKRLLADIIKDRPDYKDAALSLLVAVENSRGNRSGTAAVGTQKLVDVQRASMVTARRRLGRGRVNAIAWSADGTLLGTATGVGVYVYLLPDQLGINWGQWEDQASINDLAFSQDGRYLASAWDDGKIKLYSLNQSEKNQVLCEGSASAVGVAFSHDNRLFVACLSNGVIRAWQVQEWSSVLEIQSEDRFTTCLSLNPPGTLLATGSGSKVIKIYDATTGRLKKSLSDHTDWIQCVAFHPQKELLASGGDDGTVRFWRADSGKLIRVMSDHTRRVNCVAFSPDGRLLASGSDDRNVRIWEPESGRLLKTLSAHDGPVRSIAFRPDQSLLASGSDDGTVLLIG